MKNIHILSTDKPSRLILQTNNKFRLSAIKFSGKIASGVTQNIYITSDEEIEWDSYWLNRDNNVVSNGAMFELADKAPSCKKIILTTDQSLDGVQAIDDEFLEWFVKNPSCEEVEIFKFKTRLRDEWRFEYKIIIPKEEPKLEEDEIIDISDHDGIGNAVDNLNNEPPQETLEEASKNSKNYTKESNGYPKIQAFIDGAKWQQQNSYSEEDMAESFMACWKANVSDGIECKLSFKEWFEQFKKK